eukprot:Nk52_evm5s160 gene=Nk52_evmTU5s160
MSLSTKDLKWICFAGTFVAGLCGLFSLVFRSPRYAARRDMIFSYLNAFAGGIFLSVGLMHMMVDSTSDMQEYLVDQTCPNDPDCDVYPLGFLFVGLGFLTIFLLEKVIFAKLYKKAQLKTGASVHIHSHNGARRSHVDFPQDQCAGSSCCSGVEEVQCHKKDFVDEENVCGGSISTQSEDFEQRKVDLYAFALLSIISVHSFFAGLGLGVTDSDSDIVAQLIAIIAHKGVAAFCIGSCLVKSTVRNWLVAVFLIGFACVTPLGIAVGIAASTADNESVKGASGVLVSFSAGMFIYIASMLLNGEFYEHQFRKFACTLLGFGIMAVAAIWA